MKRMLFTLIGILFITIPVSSQEKNFIKEWIVMGTFQNSDSQLLLRTDYLNNEKQVTPSPGDNYTGREWRTETVTDAGNLNFNRMGFDVTEYCAVYTHIYVHSDREENVAVHIGSDDGVSMFVNGKLVHYNPTYRGWGADQDRVIARIGKGWNRFLFKVFNGGGGFDFSARITDLNDDVIPDLNYSINNPYKGSDFITPEVEAWIIADRSVLASEFVRNGRNLAFPIDLYMKNIGTAEVKDLNLLLSAEDENGTVILSKDFITDLNEDGPTRIFLEKNDLSRIIGRTEKLEISVNWGEKTDESEIRFSDTDILNAILRTNSLSLPPATSSKLEYLDSNLRWAMLFLGSDLEIEREFIKTLTANFLEKDWKKVESDLDGLIGKIKTVSEEIKKNTIYFAGNAHIDMAWLWKFEETVQVCYETFASALDFADKYDEFVYIQSQAQAYWWIENRFPEMFERIREKVRNGQWEIVGGMWVEPDLNVPSGEALVRQILYGKRYFLDKFGVDVKIGYNPDTFGYNLMLPQIFRKSGIEYFITQKIGWNDTNRFPHRLFWWESPDGSRLLTFFPFTYVHDARHNTTASQFRQYREMTGSRDQLVLYGVGNHGGGPTQQNIDRIQDMKALDTFPTVKESSAIDFMEVVAKSENAADYPVWNDELYLEYHRGTLTSQASTKKNNRLSEILLEEAEKFSVISGMKYPSGEINEAWRLTMFNQFHDILPGSSINEVYDDAEVQYAFVKSLTERVINKAINTTVNSIDYGDEGIPVVVFNPLSWERTELTSITPPDEFTEVMGLYDTGGNEIAYELMDGEVAFIAENVPSTGYKTYYLRGKQKLKARSELKIGEDFLENEYMRVEINSESGNITSIFDKMNGREVIESGKEGNVLELFEDIPSQWDAWNIGYTGKEWRIEDVKNISVKNNDALKVSLRIEKEFSGSRYAQNLVLYKNSPRLDIENTVDWDESHRLLKAAFNLGVKNDFATYEISYGTIQRAAVPKNSFDRAKFEVSGHKWIDMTDESGEFGVSLLNDSKYGFDVKDSKMRITLLKAPKYPDPEADIGKHKFTYSIYPHKGDWREGETYRKGYELNYPLITVEGKRSGNTKPEDFSFVKCDNPEIMITAVKKSEDSDDIIIRFFETHGKQVDTRLTFADNIVRVKETDLIERPLRNLHFSGNEITIATNPYEIKTILVKFDRN
ncbi:alpha-mannosidase [candidate division KSB1 bacterium]